MPEAAGYEIWYLAPTGRWKILVVFPADDAVGAETAYDLLSTMVAGRYRLVLVRGTRTVILADSGDGERE